MNVFGFEIKRKKQKEDVGSVITPSFDDGSTVISAPNAYYGAAASVDGIVRSDNDLIRRYREISQYADCDSAIEDIVNEAIISDDIEQAVKINLDKLKVSDSIKEKIRLEHDEILRLLRFDVRGHDIFRQWYIDGRLYYHIILDETNIRSGIRELRYVDPRKIKKIKSISKERNAKGVEVIKKVEEFYLYNDYGLSEQTTQGIKLSLDSIAFCPSGLMDADTGVIFSPLQKAIKPCNMLKMIEDASVIYRVTRAVDRRVFYIDVGNLPKAQAEQYLKKQMNEFRSKITYEVATGEVKASSKHINMLEDFWMPRREGGKGTEITTLPGGCFSMDTQISLLDGRELSIRDIEVELKNGQDLWTYSCDPITGEVKPGIISWAGVTQKSARVLKVCLDNDESFIATPDHKFPVHGKGFVELKDLSVGDELMPLYRKLNLTESSIFDPFTEEQYFDVSSKEWKSTFNIRSHLDWYVDAEEKTYRESDKYNISICITSIEELDDPIEVGTLTIDQDEVIHSYHTFALSCGVFTKNSMTDAVADLEYFQKKLFQALNVPISRLMQSEGFSIGRSQEITRDEIKFSKFVSRLRKKFSVLFLETLKIQLAAKEIIRIDEWDDLSQYIKYDYQQDNHFEEFKNAELLLNRVSVAKELDLYRGTYYSDEEIRKKVLYQTDEDIKRIDDQNRKNPPMELNPDAMELPNKTNNNKGDLPNE